MSARPLPFVVSALAVFAALPLPAARGQTPGPNLLELVPAGTAYAWHRRPDPQTRLAEGYAFEVADAALAARFDEWLLSALETAGLDPEIHAQIASVRNMVESVGTIVPWRALVEREFLYAETLSPPVCADFGIPSALLLCRPAPARREALVKTLTSFFGALAAFGQPFVRYDIVRESGADGQGPVLYRLCVPAFDDVELLQLGIKDGVLVLGLGGEYFARAYELLCTGTGARLLDEPRFRAAWGELPITAPSLTYLDVDALVAGLQDVRGLLLQREYGGGFLQGMVGEAFDLAGAVDTIATATTADGQRLVSETLTRFDPEVTTRVPLLTASLALPASPELLDCVPGDAVGFSMRGQVDLHPLYQQAVGNVLAGWSSGETVLWALDTAQAAFDLSIERDLLSWLGSEHVSIELPSRRIKGTTESVLLCKLNDPRGARKVLERLEAVYQAAVPRLLTALQDKLRAMEAGIIPEVTLGPSSGQYPMLRELSVKLGWIPIPTITYGVVGDLLVVSTSQDGIPRCLAAAAGEEDGLSAHPLAGALVGRDDLTSAQLQPWGRRLQETAASVVSTSRMVSGMLGPLAQEDPGLRSFLDIFGDFMDRVVGVLEVVDFCGDALVTSEIRDGGLARYERRTLELLLPEERPSYSSRTRDQEAAPEPGPAPEAAGVTQR